MGLCLLSTKQNKINSHKEIRIIISYCKVMEDENLNNENSQNTENCSPELIVLQMACHIYNNHEEFMNANDGKVGNVLNNDNTLCKMMRDQYPDLNDKEIKSMALALLLYLYICISTPTISSTNDDSDDELNEMDIDSLD